MLVLIKKYVVYLLSCAMVAVGLAPAAHADGVLEPGMSTAAEAARPSASAADGSAWGGWTAAYADTTEYEFPEEEEERNVIKEIIVWTGVAAFVAFFVIKVFLEGDTDETEDTGGGKGINPPLSSSSVDPTFQLRE